MQIEIAEHPSLELGLLRASFPRPIGELESPEELRAALALNASAPMQRSEECRTEVRKLLRHGGYKPTGRGKPASEYLLRAAEEGQLGSINVAVDICNVVSLHTGLPISVVDAERARAPLSIAIAGADTSYVFNASNQEIRLEGLLCLFDAEGPCANAVKDSQRTKTDATSRHTLSLIWGTRAQPGRSAAAVAWYREWLERLGATDIETSLPG